jgi:hypothetical protein
MATRKPRTTTDPKDAQKKSAKGSKPSSENTTGLIVPQTSPNTPGAPSNPPVKSETPAEQGLLSKAGELLEKGEIGVLNQAKDAVSGGIDAAVSATGGGWLAQGVGAIAKGANEILFPTNVIDLIPGGKILSGGKKAVNLGERVLTKAGKEAGKATAEAAAKGVAKKEAKEAAEKRVKDAAGGGGSYATATKRRPKHRCELMKYKDMVCDGEKHHVRPDWTNRTGSAKNKFDSAMRIPGTPEYMNGLVICLSKTEHQGIHKTVDQKIQQEGSANGTITAGKVKDISAAEAAKKSGCNPKNIRKQLKKDGLADDTVVRAVKDSRQVTEDMKNQYGRPTSEK